MLTTILACAKGNVCVAGVCGLTCPGNQTNCSGACVNLQTDQSNCKACGAVCPMGNACVAGVCSVSCPANQTNCGGGFFYERDQSATLKKVSMANGTLTDTTVLPSENHTSTDVNPNNGDIFIGPYSPTGTTLQVYHTSSNTIQTLAPAPVALGNHCTIVWVP